jgi:hypothetical protein
MFELITTDLDINGLWVKYNEYRRKGLKKGSNKILNDIVDKVLKLSESEIKAIAIAFCEYYFDNNLADELQYQVKKNIVYPVISEAFESYNAKYIRWLYQLGFLDKQISTEIYDIFGNHCVLLKKSYKCDSSDILTVRFLIDELLKSLWYGSHHFPDFILIKHDLVFDELSDLCSILSTHMDMFDGAEYTSLKDTYSSYYQLYSDWFEHDALESDIDFKDWCDIKGRNYSWCKAYYYNK